MANIIKKVGSAIAKNKEEVKVILTNYKIPYGAGKTSDLILASFKAIKSGNKELAADLAALVELDKAKTPKEKEDILAKIKEKVAAVKDKIRALLQSRKVDNSGNIVISASQAVSNADGLSGDPIDANTSELIASIDAGSPELLSKDAMENIFIGTALVGSLIMLAVIVVALYGIDRLKLKF